MLTAFLLKQRAEGVDEAAFRRHMREERPPQLRSIPELQSYDLWFPTEAAPYDSVEALHVADRSALDRLFDSGVADDLHDAGEPYVDFDREELVVTEHAFDGRADGEDGHGPE